MPRLPLGHSSDLIGESCCSPVFARKRGFNFDEFFDKVEPCPPSSATRGK